jgi:hypothetical protein
MIIKFKYGFYFEGKIYGWSGKKLHRLPQMIGTRFYPLKECATYDKGVFLGSKRKSFDQLESMTVVIDKEVSVIKDKDVPF